MKRLLNILIAVICTMLLSQTMAVNPDDIPNVQTRNRGEYITDLTGMLLPEVKHRVNLRLDSLRNLTTAECAVVIVPSTGDMEIEEFSEEVFTKWGLGRKDKDNGLLLVLAVDDRKVRIETGYGLEGALPDVACSRIIRRYIAPAMKAGDLNSAIDSATKEISGVLTDPAIRDELMSDEADPRSASPIDFSIIRQFALWVAFGIFCVMGVYFIYTLFKVRRYKGKPRLDNFQKATLWRSRLWGFWISVVLSLGMTLPFALIATWLYRRNRTKAIPCPNCGNKMHRLDEDSDNEYLDASQDLEERLNTVDYDVWKCDRCGAVERFPYKQSQTKYSQCPKCGTIAMSLESDAVLVPPTTRNAGLGERTYECRFCHNKKKERYTIPKKNDDSGLLAAGAILGAAAGRSGGGGGFSGGGFGGGSTGGGGASGGW